MEFDKSKGFCNGIYINDSGCEVTFHSLKHTHNKVTFNNCKKCTCPLARSHKKKYSEEKRGIIHQVGIGERLLFNPLYSPLQGERGMGEHPLIPLVLEDYALFGSYFEGVFAKVCSGAAHFNDIECPDDVTIEFGHIENNNPFYQKFLRAVARQERGA